MPLSDNRLIVGLNDRFSGPLAGIPYPHRKVIAYSVLQGRTVQNHADAGTAVAYAHWVGRWYRWVAPTFALLGVLSIVAGALSAMWLNFAVGFVLVGFAGMYSWYMVRVRRSVSLNEAIAQ